MQKEFQLLRSSSNSDFNICLEIPVGSGVLPPCPGPKSSKTEKVFKDEPGRLSRAEELEVFPGRSLPLSCERYTMQEECKR